MSHFMPQSVFFAQRGSGAPLVADPRFGANLAAQSRDLTIPGEQRETILKCNIFKGRQPADPSLLTPACW